MQKFVRSTAVVMFVAGLAGCAADGTLSTDFATSSVNQPQQAKADPTCAPLVAHIDELRREGVADKIEKAANKKYKMSNSDLVKADQLNKANNEFQAKCAPQTVQAAAPAAAAPAAAATPAQ